MRAVDRILQRRRIRMAAPHVRGGDRLLDIGCHDGAFINAMRARVSRAVGIDPLAIPAQDANVTILRGSFPEDFRFDPEGFDCITMLGTLEHVADPVGVSREVFRLLGPGGRLVLTVPHPIVHRIVRVLVWLGISDAMGLEVEQEFDVRSTEPMLSDLQLRPVLKRRFQLGLNHLFVFEKPAEKEPRKVERQNAKGKIQE